MPDFRTTGRPDTYKMAAMRSNRFRLLILAFSAASGCAPPAAPPDLAAPLETQVRRSSWSSPYASGEQLRSRHYRIYCTATNPQLVAIAPGFMEAAYENYLRLTSLPDRPADEPMPIYLLGTRKEWAALTLKVAGPQAGTYLKIEAGGYYRNGVCVFWDIGGLGTLAVASHEGLHQFLHHRLRQSLPIWMEEGLATLSEGYHVEGERVWFTPERNLFRFRDLRVAIVEDY